MIAVVEEHQDSPEKIKELLQEMVSNWRGDRNINFKEINEQLGEVFGDLDKYQKYKGELTKEF